MGLWGASTDQNLWKTSRHGFKLAHLKIYGLQVHPKGAYLDDIVGGGAEIVGFAKIWTTIVLI